MAQQEIKIALCGAGNVGGAVLELLTVNADFYKKMFDTDFLVTDVVTKSGKLRGYKDKFNGNIHTDFESIINNDSIDVVIEVMGGIDDAYKVAKQALESKKDFITANKAMMSLHGDELFKLAENNNLLETGKQVAMHIAATSPKSLNVEDLDPQIVEREREVLIDQAMASGKPKEIAEKMVQGRMNKFYQEVVLNEQVFVVDGETKIKDLIKKLSSDINHDVKIKGFKILKLGEGIEVGESNFAAEVAATVGI